ncbi:MAG: tripartite tricarboxylate transporter substrate binding protein [Betaproteobacteria bacterium]|nr:tripartite tricarboxylate transporter substrate binding protein [Betaproteobacteria bacterium]
MQRPGLMFGAMALAFLSLPLAAQPSPAAYPSKAVRVVVAFVPGGITDVIGRTVARQLEPMGQPVIVENRGGANGQLGSALVAKAPPDGYLLLIGSQGTHGIAPSLYAKLPYDPVKDYEHISILAVAGFLLVVHPSIPAKNLKEMIALAKKNPGKLNYASVSGSSQLMSEMINNMAGIRTIPIPYKGAVPATVAVIGGEADFLIHSFSGLMPLVQAGKLRPLGVTMDKRSPVAPDIPTISEAGLPGYSAMSWFSLLAPAGTPREVITRLNQAIVKGLKSKETIDSFASMAVDAMPMTPEQSADFARNEVAKWARVVKAAGIQPIE